MSLIDEHLPIGEARAKQLAEKWKLRLGERFKISLCAYVCEAFGHDGKEYVLKAPFDYAEERHCWATLEAFSGLGGVKILKHDVDTGSVLMPRLRLGTMLGESDLDDASATHICADLILKLRRAAKVDTMSLEQWFRELFDEPSSPMVDEARKVYWELADSMPPPVLLHGDLHHFNILRDGEEWVAIDPKGILGNPAFEVAAFMRNRVQDPPDAAGMAARLRIFADRLGDPPERLWGWAFAETALCEKQSSSDFFKPAWHKASHAIWECRTDFR